MADTQPHVGAHGQREPDAATDPPDRRDLHYAPTVQRMPTRIDPREDGSWWSPALVRDQGPRSSCAAHAVAAAVDMLLERERLDHDGVSPRPTVRDRGVPYASAYMLFGNARLHDEWPGTRHHGTSLRGALRGFRQNGVASCADDPCEWDDADWHAMARHVRREVPEAAREVVPAAYMRVEPRLNDFHAALAEVGVIVVTARVHAAWWQVDEVIRYRPRTTGGDGSDSPVHAFVVIGFTEKGFIVQNSWGPGWGHRGTAIWTYEDFAANVYDAWVMKLSVAPSDAFQYSFGPQGYAALGEAERVVTHEPTRLDVLGHLVPIEGARLLDYGQFHVDRATVQRIAELVDERGEDGSPCYRRLLLVFMAGRRTLSEAAKAVRTLRPRYVNAGIYPIFISWEAGIRGTIVREVERVLADVRERVGPHSVRHPKSAALVEVRVADIPRRIKVGVLERLEELLAETDPRTCDRVSGADFLKILFAHLARRFDDGSLTLHIQAHDLAAKAVAEIIARPDPPWGAPIVSSLHLVAPLLSLDEFRAKLLPATTRRTERPASRRAQRDRHVVDRVCLYVLDDRIAAGDLFGEGYPRSWPDLWARAEYFAVDDEADGDMKRGRRGGGDTSEPNRARLLALLPYARAAVAAADDSGALLEAYAVGDPLMRELTGLSHFDLDGSGPVTAAVIRELTGAPIPAGETTVCRIGPEKGGTR